MADQAAHIALANRTQATILHLCSDVTQFAPWIATCAFYKALHVIEAVFANDVDIGHTSDHASRFAALKNAAKYEQVYRDYCKLARASNIARYLEDRDGRTAATCFEDVYSPSVLTTRLLLTNLAQIESAAAVRLGSGLSIVAIVEIKPILENS